MHTDQRPREDTGRRSCLQAEGSGFSGASHAGTLISDCQPAELRENTPLLFKSPSVECFVRASSQTN